MIPAIESPQDSSATEAVVARHQAALWRWLRALGCEAGRADEHCQDALLAALHHGVGEVTAQLRPDASLGDLLRATFPAGTLSGAPKVRAMEIIDEVEPTRRGIYGGFIGYIDHRGHMDSCIAIRTLLAKDGRIHVQAGGGIVADSDPETEYQETLHKAGAVLSAIERAGKGKPA